jgi:hypothetical protein
MRSVSLIYTLALAALLGLTGCGGGSSEAPTAAPEPVRSLHTGRVVLIGGDELFEPRIEGPPIKRDFGPCADNWGAYSGDSVAMLGRFSLGVLNDYPGHVIIVASASELLYAERSGTLDRFASMVNHVLVSGSKLTLVGVPGAVEFNGQLKTLAQAYGAAYSDTIDVRCTQ